MQVRAAGNYVNYKTLYRADKTLSNKPEQDQLSFEVIPKN